MEPFLWVSITCSHSLHRPPPTSHQPPSKNMEDQGLQLASFSLFFSKPPKVCFVRNSFQFSHLLLREASDHSGTRPEPEMFKEMKP